MPKVVTRFEVVNNTDNELTPNTTITFEQKRLYDFMRNFYYLNGSMPEAKHISTFLGKSHCHVRANEMAGLELAGLVTQDPHNKRWTLTGFTAGLCRVPFKGEIRDDGLRTTTERVCNFFDLVNTTSFVCYRVMKHMKFKNYRAGDYIIVSEVDHYRDNMPVLFDDGCGVINIGNYTERTHGCVILDHTLGKYTHYPEVKVLGEIVGVVRLETTIDRIFTKSKIKVLGTEKGESYVRQIDDDNEDGDYDFDVNDPDLDFE